jgi:hypothetical protein
MIWKQGPSQVTYRFHVYEFAALNAIYMAYKKH